MKGPLGGGWVGDGWSRVWVMVELTVPKTHPQMKMIIFKCFDTLSMLKTHRTPISGQGK